MEWTASPCMLDPLPGKFIWTDQAVELFKSNIQSESIKAKIDHFVQKDFNNVNNMVDEVNSILVETAQMSAKFVKRKKIHYGKPRKLVQ